jgi:hypothetical protein
MKPTRVVAGVMSVLAFAAAPARADEIDDVLNLMNRVLNNIARNKTFLSNCMAFPAPASSQTIDFCNSADRPGTGLRCPPPPVADTVESGCEAYDEAKSSARTTGALSSLLSFEKKFNVTIKILYATSSIAGHTHDPDGSRTPCADRFVVRQDRFTVLFAAFQTGDASITVPIPSTVGGVDSFVATVNARSEKRRAVAIGPAFYCLKETHSAPRACDGKTQ